MWSNSIKEECTDYEAEPFGIEFVINYSIINGPKHRTLQLNRLIVFIERKTSSGVPEDVLRSKP